MDELKVGSVVQLKSGGPIMTVFRVISNDEVLTGGFGPGDVVCIWFDSKGDQKEGTFKAATLASR